jgi:hypothetical protein
MWTQEWYIGLNPHNMYPLPTIFGASKCYRGWERCQLQRLHSVVRMIQARENRSAERNPVSMPLCKLQIPQGQACKRSWPPSWDWRPICQPWHSLPNVEESCFSKHLHMHSWPYDDHSLQHVRNYGSVQCTKAGINFSTTGLLFKFLSTVF